MKYIRTLLDKLVTSYKINPKMVYVTGMSNGGMLTYRLANEMAGQDRRSSGGKLFNGCYLLPRSSRPMPILHIHSSLDTKIPYMGGVGIGGYYFPPVDSVHRAWAQHNGCAGAPTS